MDRTRLFLAANAVLWTSYGLYCLVQPGFLAEAAGVAATTPTVAALVAFTGLVLIAAALIAVLVLVAVVVAATTLAPVTVLIAVVVATATFTTGTRSVVASVLARPTGEASLGLGRLGRLGL